MRLHIYKHPNAFAFWPAAYYLEHRCGDPSCGVVHGFSIEIAFWWWTLALDVPLFRDTQPPQEGNDHGE